MSKFGSMNNFQLTRETYSLKDRVNETEEKMLRVISKTDEIAKHVFDTNEKNLREFIELIEKSVDNISLKKRVDILEKKREKPKLYPIQISVENKEELHKFLNDLKLEELYSSLIEFGVRTVEDILFLTEEDLVNEGVSLISTRKCLNEAKRYVETSQI